MQYFNVFSTTFKSRDVYCNMYMMGTSLANYTQGKTEGRKALRPTVMGSINRPNPKEFVQWGT